MEELTEREKEVLNLLCEGYSNPEISKRLFVSVHTAKSHVTSILTKFDVKTRVQAVVYAIKNNLVQLN